MPQVLTPALPDWGNLQEEEQQPQQQSQRGRSQFVCWSVYFTIRMHVLYLT